jgi:hypothetical protein
MTRRLTATLTLERYHKNFGLLDRRIQPCRSFTRGLMEFLYTQNSQLANAVTLADMDRRTIDYAISAQATGVGRIVGASGSGWDLLGISTELAAKFPGTDIGIQLGAGNTAATPTDRRMAQRIGHGTRAADGASALFESWDTGDDTNYPIHGASQAAQYFIPQSDHRIDNVEVKIYKTGAPPADLVVEIRPVTQGPGATTGYSRVINTVLATGNIAAAGVGAGAPGAFVNCALTVPVDLYAGHMYAICLYMAGGTGANCYNWRYTNAANTSTYSKAWGYNNGGPYYWIGAGSAFFTSTDNITFAPQPNVGRTCLFKEYGMSIGEMEYDATILRPIVTADPISSFEIVRRFTNLSGASITIQEVGINMVMPVLAITTGSNGNGIGMIARDVVAPGVAVADTEILVVTYTPSITV